MLPTVEQGLCLLGKSTIRPAQAQRPLVYLELKWLRRAGFLQDQQMLLSVAESPICEGGGAAGWASELAWWAEPLSPEPDSRAQSLAKQERSAKPYSQQGAVLSIQLADSIIGGSIQICLLCIQSETLSRSLAARISQFPPWDPCRLPPQYGD